MRPTLPWIWQDSAADRPCSHRPAWGLALLAGLIGIAIAGYSAHAQAANRTYALDIDGWGELVTRLQQPGARGVLDLFHDPSFWRGPIIPFIFGLVYAIVPTPSSVLAFNALAAGLAAAGLVVTFTWLGMPRLLAAGAVVFWLLYVPHHLIYGYYFAEPLIAVLSTLTFAAVAWALCRGRTGLAALAGAMAGILVLARPPFLLTLMAVTLFMWLSKRGAFRLMLAFGIALALVYAPWPLRNVMVNGALIPFTGDGSQAFFEGTWVPGDAQSMGTLREMPEFREIERQVGTLGSPVKAYKEWQRRAFAQALADPIAQVRLFIRKALRFWVFLEPYRWRASLKTGAVAALMLPLALIGAWRGRRALVVQLSLLWILGLWLFHSLVYAELRYNYAVFAMTLMLAGLGALQLYEILASLRADAAPAPARQPPSHSPAPRA
jgi:hypothetical protein